MNDKQREEYKERKNIIELLQKERNSLAVNDLSQLIAYDIVINEYAMDEQLFWAMYWDNPNEEDIKAEIEGAAMWGDKISEEDAKKETKKYADKASRRWHNLKVLAEYFSKLIKESEDSLYQKYCELRKRYPSPYHTNLKSRE